MRLSKRIRPSRRTAAVALILGAAFVASESRASAATTCDRAITDIQRYCSACWRNARIPLDSWPDCTQEVLFRLMERVPLTNWDRVLRPEGDERQEFVRAIDAGKKRSQRSRTSSSRETDVPHHHSRNTLDLADRREELNRAAQHVLSVRQKRIM